MLQITNESEFKHGIEEFFERLNFLESPDFLRFVDNRVRKHFDEQFRVGGMDPETGYAGYWERNKGKYAEWKRTKVGHNIPGRLYHRMWDNVLDAHLDADGSEDGLRMVWSWFEDEPVRYSPPPKYPMPIDRSRPYPDYQTYYQNVSDNPKEYKIIITEEFLEQMIEEVFADVLEL